MPYPDQLTASADAVIQYAFSLNFKPENIIFHGNNKSLAEIAFAIDNKVELFAVDSFFEIVVYCLLMLV
jgi:diaminopimelate decarboxylase